MLDIRKAFRAAGLRHTRQREAVFAALRETDTHPTAEELFEIVREREPGLSLATVYNSLDVLTDGKLCQRLPSNGGPTRYDADLRDHIHLILQDGRVLDVPDAIAGRLRDAIPEGLLEQLEARSGVSIGSLGIQLVASEPVDPKPARHH